MQERTFYAMNTEWWVRAYGATGHVMDEAEALVHEAEAHLSRFRERSAVGTLNRQREVCDAMLGEVLRSALRFRDATAGVFDPAAGASLLAAGYDRSFEGLTSGRPAEADARRPRVIIEGDKVRLEGQGSLDLGGIGKGWAVDRVADFLEANNVDRYFVDGGGDLRAGTTPAARWPVGVGEGLVAWLGPGAIATSSTARRRWTDCRGGLQHHVIDPSSGAPAVSGIATAVVAHRRATAADVLATTLVAGGVGSLAAVQALGGEALLEMDEGGWWMTPGMQRWIDGTALS